MDIKGLSVIDVQQFIGLSTPQAVYHWLNGRSLPTLDNVYALSELFNVPVDRIICGNRSNQPEYSGMHHRLKVYVKYLQSYFMVAREETNNGWDCCRIEPT